MMRIISKPFKLYWAGWKTDTLSLQKEGWCISVSENHMMSSLRIAIKNDSLNIRGISNFLYVEYERFLSQYVNNNFNIDINISVAKMSMSERIFMIDQPEYEFIPIDAKPTSTQKYCDFDDLILFKKVEVIENVKDIFLKDASMSEILRFALNKQEPEQERIRKEMIKRQELQNLEPESKLKARLRLIV